MYFTPYRSWMSTSLRCASATCSAVAPRMSWRSMKIGMGVLTTRGARSRRGLDVLVHSEQVGGVVFFLQRCKPVVVLAVSSLDPRLPLVVHHEVRVGARQIERMDGFPIGLRPLLQRRRVGIDPDPSFMLRSPGAQIQRQFFGPTTQAGAERRNAWFS